MASITDDFNRANGALGANWTDLTAPGLVVVSNAAVAAGAGTYCEAQHVSTLATDVFQVRGIVGTRATDTQIFLLLRKNSVNSHYVYTFWGGTDIGITYAVGAGDVALTTASGMPSFTTADELTFKALGRWYICLKNGVVAFAVVDTAVVTSMSSSHRGVGMSVLTTTLANTGLNSFAAADVAEPAIMAVGNAVTTASRSPSIAFGATYVPLANDVVVFFAASTAAAALATAASGWVMPTPASGANPVASDSHTQCFQYHLVTAGEQTAVTTTYTATNLWNANQTGNVVGVVLRNIDPANVIDSLVSGLDSANAATPFILPALTGTNLSTNSVVIGAVAKDGTGTYTTPSGWAASGSNNTNQGQAIFIRHTPTIAGTNVTTTNVTPSAGDEYCAFTAAFSGPAAAAPADTSKFFAMF